MRENVDLQRKYQISPFGMMRPWQDGWIAESIATGRRMYVTSLGAARVLLSFTHPIRPTELLARVAPESRAALERLVGDLYAIGVLTESSGGEEKAPDSNGPVQAWEFHDLAFHVKSRRGRNPDPIGATWHQAQCVADVGVEQEALRSKIAEIALPIPSAEDERQDWSLTRALANRRSRYSAEAVPLTGLAGLLYHAFRVTERFSGDGEKYIRKVFPSGGSRHSLSVYLVVNRCTDLPPGAYRYDHFRHRLDFIRHQDDDQETLLVEAQRGTGGNLKELPSVLLIFAARFSRVTRKYQSLAYRLVLQEVGAAYQTAYLVAETLGLAVSAIGTGDSERFAKAFDLDFYGEPSVGEMIVSGRQNE